MLPSFSTERPSTPIDHNAFQEIITTGNQGNYIKALQKIDGLLMQFPENVDLLSYKAYLLIQLKQYERADGLLRQLLLLNPQSFAIKCNLAEALFLQKKHRESLDVLDALLESPLPKVEVEFVRYKALLNSVFVEKKELIEKRLSQFDLLGETPAYYFARAVWHFFLKQPEKATEFLSRAQRIYPPEALNPYMDGLIEAGWIMVENQ